MNFNIPATSPPIPPHHPAPRGGTHAYWACVYPERPPVEALINYLDTCRGCVLAAYAHARSAVIADVAMYDYGHDDVDEQRGQLLALAESAMAKLGLPIPPDPTSGASTGRIA